MTKSKQRTYHRKWRREHRKECCAYSRKWRRAHPKECRAICRKRYREHPKKWRAVSRKWRHEHLEKYRAVKRKWYREHKDSCRASSSRGELKKALRLKILKDGWPDAANIEQKIGADYVRASQWALAARHESCRGRHASLVLFFAKTHEDAVRKIGQQISFNAYARKLDCSNEWKKLVQKWA